MMRRADRSNNGRVKRCLFTMWRNCEWRISVAVKYGNQFRLARRERRHQADGGDVRSFNTDNADATIKRPGMRRFSVVL